MRIGLEQSLLNSLTCPMSIRTVRYFNHGNDQDNSTGVHLLTISTILKTIFLRIFIQEDITKSDFLLLFSLIFIDLKCILM